jgi:hypothetical protein
VKYLSGTLPVANGGTGVTTSTGTGYGLSGLFVMNSIVIFVLHDIQCQSHGLSGLFVINSIVRFGLLDI